MVNSVLDGFENISVPSFPDGLSQSELARWFKVQPSTVKRQWKNDQETSPNSERFAQWSKEKDPDHIAWIKKGDRYFPIA